MKRGSYKSKDARYAKQIGMSLKAIRLRGGYDKLHAMTPEAHKLMMGDHHYGNSQTIAKGGMKARGMPLGRWPVVRTQFGREAKIEAEIQRILRERGLLK